MAKTLLRSAATLLGLAALATVFFLPLKRPVQDQSSPIYLYSNELRDPLQHCIAAALLAAEHSIWVSMYSLSDPLLIKILRKQAEAGIAISIRTDREGLSLLQGQLPPSIHLEVPKSLGLMHEKIVIIDHHTLLLGSTNWTPTSLLLHANLIMQIEDPLLCAFFEESKENYTIREFDEQHLSLYRLPLGGARALQELLSQIQGARQSIEIAMFTLTHPELVSALAEASERGVSVRCFADHASLRGASRASWLQLHRAGCEIRTSFPGEGLLHHKWAVIDGRTWIMGSANWTRAAFERNCDLLLILEPLSSSQKKFLEMLQKALLRETRTYVETPPCYLTHCLSSYRQPFRCSS